MSKINLTLLNKLVKELTLQQEVADKIDAAVVEHKQEYTVELAKAFGILSTIKMEAELLMQDYSRQIRVSTATVPAELDPMADIFGSLFPAGKTPKNQS